MCAQIVYISQKELNWLLDFLEFYINNFRIIPLRLFDFPITFIVY